MIEQLGVGLGISIKAFVAGSVGGLVSVKFFDNLSMFGVITTVLIGGVSAGYSTSWVMEFLEVSPSHDGAMGFVIGLFGMSVFSSIFKALRAADLWGLIKRRI